MDSIIKGIKGLNEEVEQLIDEIEYMSMKEERLYEISNENSHYGGYNNDLRRTSREIMEQE